MYLKGDDQTAVTVALQAVMWTQKKKIVLKNKKTLNPKPSLCRLSCGRISERGKDREYVHISERARAACLVLSFCNQCQDRLVPRILTNSNTGNCLVLKFRDKSPRILASSFRPAERETLCHVCVCVYACVYV